MDQYRYWHPKHELLSKLRAPIAETDWRQLLVERVLLERQAQQLFGDLLNSQVDRIAHSDSIVRQSYDAKDFLLKQLDTPPSADDYLSRTWWAQTLLAQVERRTALDELFKLREGHHTVSLERALACIDLLIIPCPPESLDQIDAVSV